jgi:phage terminase large subunit-like protein
MAADLATLPDETVEEILGRFTVVELAALWHDWAGFWARPAQLPPSTNWRSLGFLTGRGFGKTRALSEYVNVEAMAGRAMRIGLAAQNEDKTLEVMVHGKSGLIACSPPWFRARFEVGRVIWPNGAQAFIYTPEVPGDLRGPEHDLFWATELVAWPAATRDEAWSNIRRGTRTGYARTLWDTTPKRRHPLIRALLARSMKNPTRHIVVRGSTMDNVANLQPDEVAEWFEEMGGTQAGDEELLGIYLDSDDEALWHQLWIDAHRRPMPEKRDIVRRVLALDPAIGTSDTSDNTGISEAILTADGQVLPVADLSGKHEAHVWGALALDRYVEGECDLIVAELNRGGNLVTQNLRSSAEGRGLRIEVVDVKWKPHRTAGVVYVREVNSKGSKAERCAPVATLYQKGRVSHPEGAKLEALETLMTSWVPPPPGTRAGGRRSPDALDAVTMAVVELAGLGRKSETDPRLGFRGAGAVAATLVARPAARSGGLAAAIPRRAWAGKI